MSYCHRESGTTPYLPPLSPSSLVALVLQRQALSARHRGAVLRGNAFHFGPVSRFLVARIAQYHAVLREGVLVTFLSAVPGQRPSPERSAATSPCLRGVPSMRRFTGDSEGFPLVASAEILTVSYTGSWAVPGFACVGTGHVQRKSIVACERGRT